MNNPPATIKLLFIEDDAVDQLAFEKTIKSRSLPYDLTVSNTIATTKQLLLDQVFDVIIADYELPDGDFFDLVGHIDDIPVIFVTGAGNQEVAVRAMKVDVYDYIVKDVEHDYLNFLPLRIEQVIAKYESKSRIQQLESAIIHSNDAIAIFDYSDKIFGLQPTFWNKSFEQIFAPLGSPEKVTIARMIDLNGNINYALSIKKLITNSLNESVELKLRHLYTDKDVWVEMSFLTVYRGKSKHKKKIAAFIKDITEKKHEEKLLINAIADADKAKKVEQQFLATMSHEIRTPITSIIGLADLLSNSALNKTQLEYVEAIKNSTGLLLALINDVLDLSKIEKGGIELFKAQVNLKEFIENSVTPFVHIAESKELELKITFDEQITTDIETDITRLNQIIVNLISNAVKFTDSGSITVGVNVIEDLPERYVVRFEVQDTGIGIREEDIPLIFNKYKQLDSYKRHTEVGTGLGLYIVNNLISLFDSKLHVDSELGVGTRFSFELTLKKVNDADNAPTLESNYNLEDAHIMIVDDNVLNRKILGNVLSKQGAKTVLLQDGIYVLDELRENKDVNLILLDMNMPILNGRDTINIVRDNMRSNIPIIVLSASEETGLLTKEVQGKIHANLLKPYKYETLYELIESARTVDTSPSTALLYDLKHLRGKIKNESFIEEMVQHSLDYFRDSVANIDTWIETENYTELERMAHSLISSGMHMGSEPLMNICRMAEEAVQKKSIKKFAILCKIIKANCQTLVGQLETAFPDLNV